MVYLESTLDGYAAFFGLAGLISFLRLVNGYSVPVVITLSGFHDKRMTVNEIPRSHVSEIGEWAFRSTVRHHIIMDILAA